MLPAPSPARLHAAALVVLLVASAVAWLTQRPARARAARMPAVAAAPAPEAPAAAGLLWGGQLDVNRASADDLAALPGIGPVRAGRIVATRTARGGRFEAVEDLLEVPGIGPVTLARLRPHVRVE